MDNGYNVKSDVKAKTTAVKSKVSSSSSSLSRSASPSPSPSPSPSVVKSNAGKVKGDKMTRGEMDKTREELKARIEEQGKKGYKQVKSEVN